MTPASAVVTMRQAVGEFAWGVYSCRDSAFCF